MLALRSITEQQAFPDTGLAQTFLHLRRNIDKGPAGGHLKPEFLMIIFHDAPFDKAGLWQKYDNMESILPRYRNCKRTGLPVIQ